MVSFDFAAVLAEWPLLLKGAAMTLGLSSASATLVASSQGLRASQRSFRRAPASNSSSASAPSMATRSAGSSPSAPRPAMASAVPTST